MTHSQNSISGLIPLVGLPGRKEVRTPARIVHSAAQAVAMLTKRHAVTASGPRGAINLYVQDDGSYRCMFMCRGLMLSDIVLRSREGVRMWLKGFFPRLERTKS